MWRAAIVHIQGERQAMEVGDRVRRYGLAIGLAAGVVTWLQALIAGSAASSHLAETLALQRALIAYRDGTGGPLIDPQIDRLVPMFIVTYVTAGIALLVTLGFSWYAGRVASLVSGRTEDGTRAGQVVAWASWLCWCGAALLAIALFRADGTLSWLAATAAKLTFTPESTPITGMYVTSPDGVFLALQLGAFLVQAGVGLAVAVYCGGVAGRVGSAQRSPGVFHRWSVSRLRSRLQAALGATRARLLRSREK